MADVDLNTVVDKQTHLICYLSNVNFYGQMDFRFRFR